MSMSIHLVGVVDHDTEEFRNMVAVADACDRARVPYPDTVQTFFAALHIDTDTSEWRNRRESTVDLMGYAPIGRKWQDEDSSGIEIDVKDIPANVKTVRFYNSW